MNYKKYWNMRYKKGGNSGIGSYNEFAEYKSNIINNFISKNNIKSVIEFGCGDGNQLKHMNFDKYLGMDISEHVVKLCIDIFKDDKSKSFMVYNPSCFQNKSFIKSDLVICLDVLYHIIDEYDYVKTLNDIFCCSNKYVILYTSVEAQKKHKHVYHRPTLDYLNKIDNFEIIDILENPNTYSSAKMIILEKRE